MAKDELKKITFKMLKIHKSCDYYVNKDQKIRNVNLYLIWIRPEEITEKPLIRDVSGAHNTSDLLHRLEVGAQSTMATENLFFHNSGDGETIETVCESFPQLDVVSALACKFEFTMKSLIFRCKVVKYK